MFRQDHKPHIHHESHVHRDPEELLQAHPLGRKCLAEFLGTAFLVFIGCGTLTSAGYLEHNKAVFNGADLLLVALAFGLALAVMVYAVGHISGCHINPAISFALAVARRMRWSEAGAYIVAQLLGGLLGALLIAVTYGRPAASLLGYGATDYNTLFVNYFGAIVVEAIGTFFLAFAVMAMVIDKRTNPAWAGLVIGLTLTLCIMVLGPVTGGNLNPARAFGPTLIQMLFGGAYPFGHMFVYFIGPAIGAVAGVFAYHYLAGLSASSETRETRYGHVETGD
ncbi:MAG TPA: aquaporin [Ktedonobacteraceae bacterium]